MDANLIGEVQKIVDEANAKIQAALAENPTPEEMIEHIKRTRQEAVGKITEVSKMYGMPLQRFN